MPSYKCDTASFVKFVQRSKQLFRHSDATCGVDDELKQFYLKHSKPVLRRNLLLTVRNDDILFVFGHVVFLQEVVNTIKYGKQYV